MHLQMSNVLTEILAVTGGLRSTVDIALQGMSPNKNILTLMPSIPDSGGNVRGKCLQ